MNIRKRHIIFILLLMLFILLQFYIRHHVGIRVKGGLDTLKEYPAPK